MPPDAHNSNRTSPSRLEKSSGALNSRTCCEGVINNEQRRTRFDLIQQIETLDREVAVPAFGEVGISFEKQMEPVSRYSDSFSDHPGKWMIHPALGAWNRSHHWKTGHARTFCNARLMSLEPAPEHCR